MFRPYLVGTTFVLETDHKSLEALMKATSPPRLVRWSLSLSEYTFTIKHRQGKFNLNADGLSRLTSDEASSTAPCRLDDILNVIQKTSMDKLKISDDQIIFAKK